MTNELMSGADTYTTLDQITEGETRIPNITPIIHPTTNITFISGC